MNYAHLFEASMLVCFGFSWPLNVVKAYRAGTAKGTSLPFIILIITGYIAGISAKIINGQFNYVFAVYLLNLTIVMTNVFVYIRNKALDKKAEDIKNLKVNKIELKVEAVKEENMTNYTNSLDELISKPAKAVEKKNAVILLGGTSDKAIPVSELAKEYNFNFDIYNKSSEAFTLANAKSYFQANVAELKPEAVLIHIGESELNSFANDYASFDKNYLELVEEIKLTNKNCRIALVSADGSKDNKTANLMNAHIKAIAEAERAAYVSLENAKLWNPEATKAASNFAYDMGLKIRKPLRDVAEILYSWAYHNVASKSEIPMVG